MRKVHYLMPVALTTLALLAGLIVFGTSAGAVRTQATLTVVATGLDNPRGLAFGSDGALYVAEAGRGGSGPCAPGPEGGEVCYGATGAITRILTGTQQRIVSGLPSLANQEGNTAGSSATGPHDVSVLRDGTGYVAIGLGFPPTQRSQFGTGGAKLGYLVSFTSGITTGAATTNLFDMAGYEQSVNPDGEGPDSNPYALLALHDRLLAVDAGGNDLIELDASGNVITATVFPSRTIEFSPSIGLAVQVPLQSVPDTIAIGPDAAYYVGELTGGPFPVGGARVYRVVPGRAPEIYAAGFTNIIDTAFDRAGNLYVLEIAANGLGAAFGSGDFTGALIQVTPELSATTILTNGLIAPTSLAIGPNGGIYISNAGIFSGTGQVVQVNLCDPDDSECTEPLPLPIPFVATATGEQEVDNTGNPGQGDPDGRGSGLFTLDADVGQVCVQATVSGIAQPTMAHIHRGAARTNGPVVVNFTPLITGTLISGCVEAEPDTIRSIQSNPSSFYLNVHNTDFPNGAVRGQLVRGDEPVAQPRAPETSLYLPVVQR